MNKMSKKQSGFTLIEIAIVLVIIGLLLGGVLQGQQLIENSRVRNAVNTINGTSAAAFAYVDRYRRFPGDDAGAVTARGASWPAFCECVGERMDCRATCRASRYAAVASAFLSMKLSKSRTFDAIFVRTLSPRLALGISSAKNMIAETGTRNSTEYFSIKSSDGVLIPFSISEI